jgi:UDP-N-acetylglucosamine diphosphorylase/glucosamine-1-phosphate N-acetyltransferase
LTLSEAWNSLTKVSITLFKQDIGPNVRIRMQEGQLNDRWLPTTEAIETLIQLPEGVDLYFENSPLFRWNQNKNSLKPARKTIPKADLLQSPTELFIGAGKWIEDQAQEVLGKWGATTAANLALPAHVLIIGPRENLIVAPGARILASTINTESGPVLLGPDSEIQEGCNIRGPLYLGAHSIVKMGAKIYGPTSIGDHCRIGGEVSNSVFLGYSNKGHDGFVGNSVIGHWCNLGAATNTSNLKSNYSQVKLWNENAQALIESDLQFCGLVMGDHSKSGINTMFNTGSVVGPGCNIYGSGFQPKHIPPFSWGGGVDWNIHDFAKFIKTANAVMERRGQKLTETEIERWRIEHQHRTAKA